MDISNAIQLNIPNVNNKFSKESFTEINFAPGRPIGERELTQKVFVLKDGEQSYFCKIVDMLRLDFDQITDALAMEAYGVEAYDFWLKFIQENPGVHNKTKMAVYYYQRIKH